MIGRMPPIVMDNGTGYTKMGFAGNREPQYVFPTAIAIKETKKVYSKITARTLARGMSDLDFYIGNEALNATTYSVQYPIQRGIVEDWDLMERFWEQCIYKYLRADPEEHYFLLTEPLFNRPENREYMAEIMFETFNIPGLYIAIQATLSMISSWICRPVAERTLTGFVIESGHGITQCIPIVDGYLIGACIKQIPIAGNDINSFIQTLLLERESSIPAEQSLQTANSIKERYCYVCPDIGKEFEKYDKNPNKWVKKYSMNNVITKKLFEVEVGFEQFLGPEVLFSPELVNQDFLTPLPELVDSCIKECPIDYRRPLYKNIVLSGGSTMFKHFERRLKRDINRLVTDRQKRIVSVNKSKLMPKPIEVNVVSHPLHMNAVWCGGSYMASNAQFHNLCNTKAAYEEHGSSLYRYSAAFASMK